MYGSHMNATRFSYRVFHTCFLHDFPHVTHVNHLEIYTGILYISHMNHIGMLYRNHMFQDTHMFKLLTCGGDINVATIQLLCGYHTTPMRLPYRNYCVPHGSCMVGTWELYGSHMATIHSTNVQGVSPIQLPCGYHTTLMRLPHSFCMTTIQL